jgi:phage baseplate assembly protein gpV
VPGEFWLVHLTGASLKLVTSGAIVMNAPAGVQIAGNVAVTGSITATGNITGGEGTGDQVGLTTHKHTSETVGTPTTSPIAGT